MTHGRRTDGELASDSGFWQSATVSVPLATASGIFTFAFIVGVFDEADSSPLDDSPAGVFAVVVLVLLITGGLCAWRRTPRALGAAAGAITATTVFGLVWLGTL